MGSGEEVNNMAKFKAGERYEVPRLVHLGRALRLVEGSGTESADGGEGLKGKHC